MLHFFSFNTCIKIFSMLEQTPKNVIFETISVKGDFFQKNFFPFFKPACVYFECKVKNETFKNFHFFKSSCLSHLFEKMVSQIT